MEKKEFVLKVENKVQKSVWKMLKKNKDEINATESILVIAGIIIGFLICLAGFLKYLFIMQHFNHWNIDITFYENMNVTHEFIYMVCIFGLILLFVVFASDKYKWLQYEFFVLLNIVIGYLQLFNSGLTITWVLTYFIIPTILYIFVPYLPFFVKMREKLRRYPIIVDISNLVLGLVYGVFILVSLYGMFSTLCQKQYMVIRKNEKIKYVVLYSAKDYYIVADCNERKNILSVNHNIQQKISTENVEYEIITFDKIEK